LEEAVMYRVVDLTYTLDARQPALAGHPRLQITAVHTFAEHGRSNMAISCSLHQGTHVDAPSHFVEGQASIDAVPLDRLVGPAVLADLRGRVGPGNLVQVADIQAGLPPGVEIRGKILVLFTGWSAARFHQPDYYERSPGLHGETAAWLARQGIRALVLDMPTDVATPGGPRHGDAPGHRALLGAGIPLIEHVGYLDQLQSRQFLLIAAPIKVGGGDGAPARVLALEGLPLAEVVMAS
jgi:kynurenine formamidase